MRIFTFSLLTTVFILGGIAAVSSAYAKTSTEDFVHMASIANSFEIQSSKLALEKSQSKEIKSFAQRMIDDHTKAEDELHQTLQTADLDPSMAQDTLDNKNEKIFDKLQTASGDDFNKQYVSAQTDAHKDAVKLFSDYAKHGDNTALKDFAAKTLPTLKDHLKHVEHLKP
jgi:putative membrane protein